jgi:hypothetical protein
MNEPRNRVSCSVHGEQDETFVCQHIMKTLHTRLSLGFIGLADLDAIPDLTLGARM